MIDHGLLACYGGGILLAKLCTEQGMRSCDGGRKHCFSREGRSHERRLTSRQLWRRSEMSGTAAWGECSVCVSERPQV